MLPANDTSPLSYTYHHFLSSESTNVATWTVIAELPAPSEFNRVAFIDTALQAPTLVTTGLATVANAVVCVTLCYVILSPSSPVNVLIANQVTIDLFASFLSFVSFVLRLWGKFNIRRWPQGRKCDVRFPVNFLFFNF